LTGVATVECASLSTAGRLAAAFAPQAGPQDGLLSRKYWPILRSAAGNPRTDLKVGHYKARSRSLAALGMTISAGHRVEKIVYGRDFNRKSGGKPPPPKCLHLAKMGSSRLDPNKGATNYSSN